MRLSVLCLTSILLAGRIVAADDSVDALIAQIEGPQAGGGELSGLSLAQVMDQFHLPGASVAVINDFRIHWAKGYGTADVISGDAVNTDTLFQAARSTSPCGDSSRMA